MIRRAKNRTPARFHESLRSLRSAAVRLKRALGRCTPIGIRIRTRAAA